MNYILFDSVARTNLLPLTFTRPVADIRFGILTIRQKWEKYLNATTSSLTEPYLSQKFPMIKANENLLINGSICPTKKLVNQINKLEPGQTLAKGDTVIAMCLTAELLESFVESDAENTIIYDDELLKIDNTWDIFNLNGEAIKEDFDLLDKRKKIDKN